MHLDLGVVADFDDHVVIADAGDLAENSAGGQNLIALFECRDQSRVRFLLFLLRTNQQEIESGKNDDHWQQHAEWAGLLGALRVRSLN